MEIELPDNRNCFLTKNSETKFWRQLSIITNRIELVHLLCELFVQPSHLGKKSIFIIVTFCHYGQGIIFEHGQADECRGISSCQSSAVVIDAFGRMDELCGARRSPCVLIIRWISQSGRRVSVYDPVRLTAVMVCCSSCDIDTNRHSMTGGLGPKGRR